MTNRIPNHNAAYAISETDWTPPAARDAIYAAQGASQQTPRRSETEKSAIA